MKTRLILLAVLIVITAAVVLLAPRSEPAPAAEEPAALILPEGYDLSNDFTYKLYPDFTGESGQTVGLSEEHRLAEHAGKPVVAVFWASWNAPSRDQLGILAPLADEMGEEADFVLLPVNVGKAGKDSETKAAIALGEGEGARALPLCVDLTGVVRFNVTSTPQTFFIDQNGKLAASVSGICTGEEILRQVGEMNK